MCKPSAIALMLMLPGPALLATPEEAQAMQFFETKIRPVLAESCFECHGEKKQKGGLRLDNLGYMLSGGDGGPAVVPGDAMASLLYKSVSYLDKDLQMPPKDKKLPDNQIEDIQKWIDMGAPWPKAEIVTAKKPGEFTEEEKSWWAFQPVKVTTPPEVAGFRIANPIDKFIAQKLSAGKIPQAPEADRRELVRRLYYDMHGLPPTAEQTKAFLEDKRPDAYERLVDELLASPNYGVRWGQHWLDVVRYAESDGYREDAYRPNAWPYRDYVIRSFNEDKPYDQFVREQIAGDEINPDDPNVLIGTAFLRHGIYEWNQRDAEGQRKLMVEEMTDVTGEVFLGLSFACAKCHDHKFDPILQKDYYRLRSFFNGVQWREDVVLATPEQKARHAEEMKAWEEASREPREAYEAALKPKLDGSRRRATEIFPEEVKAMVAKPDEERLPYEKLINYLVERQVMVDHNRTIAKFRQTPSPVLDAMKPFEETKPKPLPTAFVATDVGKDSPPNILKSRRGDTDVKPGFLTILKPDEIEVKPLGNSSGRRTALAAWITDPSNPLSTRVIVNRVWQYHFGRGLAENTSDFGKLGSPPTHPELLDWLTHEFVSGGWSVKKLHRLILNSETYRQSTLVAPTELTNKVDPSNKLLWRMSPRRLDAEQTRDTLLMLSGELRAEQTSGPAADTSEPVRSVFTRKRRNSPDEFLTRFDAPPGFLSVSKRETTTTALQSLVMINGEWPLQRARAMAARLLKDETKAEEGKIASEAITLAYSRPAKEEEVKEGITFLKSQEKVIAKDKPAQPATDLNNPVADSGPFFNRSPFALSKAILFKPGSQFEKLRVKSETVETPEFTVEAVVNVDSVYPDSAVRTIVSRWNGDMATKGWSIGLTGKSSKYKGNHLIFEISGDDFQGALVREVVASNIFIPENTPYYVAASVTNKPMEGKSFGGSVTFHALNLADPAAKPISVTVPHGIGSGYVNPERALVIGGRDTASKHLWSGAISSLTISNGVAQSGNLLIDKPMTSPVRIVDANADALGDTYKPIFSWDKSGQVVSKSKSGSPKLEAVTDFLHTLINSNEFFYLP
jgi:mono/diheme cytochrome c family protein